MVAAGTPRTRAVFSYSISIIRALALTLITRLRKASIQGVKQLCCRSPLLFLGGEFLPGKEALLHKLSNPIQGNSIIASTVLTDTVTLAISFNTCSPQTKLFLDTASF